MALPPYNYDDEVMPLPGQESPSQNQVGQLDSTDLQGQLSQDPTGNIPVQTDQAPPLVMPADEASGVLTPETMEKLAIEDPDLLTPEELAALSEGNEGDSNATDHYVNLAKDMEANVLNKIAQELIQRVEDDEESRKDWFNRVKDGIRNLGVSDKTSGGADFPGASKVVHPVLMEACTQFQARAIQELWPAAGPVKTQVLGEQSNEKQDQAKRVQNYMNYLYTVEMTEAFTEEDNMLLRLPISGSTFKKMFYDPIKKRLSSIYIEPSDFLISYQTTDLRTSPRFAHRIREYKNDVKKKEATGFYVETDLGNIHSEDTDKPVVIDEIDSTEGKKRVSYYAEDEDRATMYEVYVDYNVEDIDDQKAITKPYIITVDRDQQRVKRIQRNWKPDDETQTKRMYFTHYRFTPGLGFYGYGFLHLIGDLAATATGSLRALLDSAAFANMQGGFRTRDSRTPGGDKPIAPGEWREVASTGDELRKAFFNIPYKEPSATLFQLLGYIDDKAKHLAGTTETVTGETNPNNAPVGTTAMLLEQGTKVFTAIHKRIHEAHKEEFQIMAELVEEYMPDEGYPYLVGEQEGTLMPQDFDERIDVIPVSDPNISSNAQRVAKAQSILELQQAYPNTIPEREAVRRMLEAIQVQAIDALLGTDEEQAQQDQEAAAKQAEMEELEKQRLNIETQKLEAEKELAQARSVRENIEAMKLSFEAAAIATTNTALVKIADMLMASAGYVDPTGGETMVPGGVPQQMPLPGMEGMEGMENMPDQFGQEPGMAGEAQMPAPIMPPQPGLPPEGMMPPQGGIPQGMQLPPQQPGEGMVVPPMGEELPPSQIFDRRG